MKSLVVDDDFTCRRILKTHLSKYGVCNTAASGEKAIEEFKLSLNDSEPYDLITLDIMMPEMNGHEALRVIRDIEEENGIFASACVKILMTTALNDCQNIKDAFKEQCDGYLVKPINKDRLVEKLIEIDLIRSE